jgi:hypothetical protein
MRYKFHFGPHRFITVREAQSEFYQISYNEGFVLYKTGTPKNI